MKSLKQTLILLLLLLSAAALAACGDAQELYGKIIEITDRDITIETGTFQASSEEGTGSFVSDGGTASYSLSSNINTQHLSENMIVKLTLQNETVTAVEASGDEGGDSSDGTDPYSETVDLSAALTIDEGEQAVSDKEYDSSKADVSTILLKNKASLTLDNCTLTKSGDVSGSSDETSSRGLNAVFAASGQSTATLKSSILTSSGNGANAIFSADKGTKVTASDFKIYTTGDSSRGLFASLGGSISASGGDITTKGDLSAPVSAGQDQAGIQVRNTTVSSEGSSSPCLYSAGSITASKLSGSASGSQIAVINGAGSAVLKSCLLQGAGKAGLTLFDTGSGTPQEGASSLRVTDSKLTTTSDGPMFYVTNTQGTITLKNTALYYSSGVLVKAAGNRSGRWGTPGKNGGDLTLKGTHQTLTGDITCDAISTVALKLSQNSLFQGAVNPQNTAKSVSVSLDKTSRWEVTEDSYLSKITNKNTKCKNIRSNGHTIYYDAGQKSNAWLKGKTLSLPGGGKLTPAPTKEP